MAAAVLELSSRLERRQTGVGGRRRCCRCHRLGFAGNAWLGRHSQIGALLSIQISRALHCREVTRSLRRMRCVLFLPPLPPCLATPRFQCGNAASVNHLSFPFLSDFSLSLVEVKRLFTRSTTTSDSTIAMLPRSIVFLRGGKAQQSIQLGLQKTRPSSRCAERGVCE